MMDICKIIKAELGSVYPPELPAKSPAELRRIGNDLRLPLDCELAGVAITSSTWAIDPDDDDGALILTGPASSGLYTSVRLDNGTDGRDYRINNTVETTDGQTYVFPWSLPVRSPLKRTVN